MGASGEGRSLVKGVLDGEILGPVGNRIRKIGFGARILRRNFKTDTGPENPTVLTAHCDRQPDYVLVNGVKYVKEQP